MGEPGLFDVILDRGARVLWRTQSVSRGDLWYNVSRVQSHTVPMQSLSHATAIRDQIVPRRVPRAICVPLVRRECPRRGGCAFYRANGIGSRNRTLAIASRDGQIMNLKSLI
jgi:hypothetical protein